MDFEEKESGAFTWTSLFMVTGISSLLFSGILKILDENSWLFFRIGLAAIGLGVLSYLNQWLGKIIAKRRTSPE